MKTDQQIVIKGNLPDNKTRCKHYHSDLDIIAIKFKCCNTYYACYDCHEEIAGHPAQVWRSHEADQKAILCGNCKTELSIREYKSSNAACPFCNAAFNPKCANHYDLYFENETDS